MNSRLKIVFKSFTIGAIALSSISGVLASEFMEIGSKDFKSKKIKQSRWQFDIGAHYLKYPAGLPSFNGKHAKIKSDTEYELLGLGLGVGPEIMVGKGFSITIKVGGFYSKFVDKITGQAAQDIDYKVATTESDHSVYGAEASVSLNYMIETSIINVQPFIEMGAGSGKSTLDKDYEYTGLSSDGSDKEEYTAKMEEDFAYARATVGVNFISHTGIISYIKASNMAMNIIDRKVKGSSTIGSTVSSLDSDGKVDESSSVFSASLGIGYLF